MMTPKTSPTLGRLALAAVLSLSCAVPAYAQQGATRSREIGRPPDKDGEVTQGRYVFAGIGIDDYEHDDIWAGLDNAVNDVVAVREMLQGTFEFEAPEEWLLTNEEATAANIRILIDDLRLNCNRTTTSFFSSLGTAFPYLWSSTERSSTTRLMSFPLG